MGFGIQRKRVAGVHSPLLHVAEDGGQIVLLLQWPVSYDLVSAPLQLPRQPPHVPFRYPQFLGCLLLGDQLFLRLLQGHQAVPFGLRQQQLYFCHLPSLKASIGHFYFAQIGHNHFAATESE